MAQTYVTDLDGNSTNSPYRSVRVEAATGSGNWQTINLVSARKYSIRHMGFDSAGAVCTSRVKILYNATTEPNVTLFGYECDTEWLTHTNTMGSNAVLPKIGLSQVSLKGEGAAIVQITEIDTTQYGWHV